MRYDTAEKFWVTHLAAVNGGNANEELFNSLEDFRARAHAGEFDSLTDDQYFEKEREAEDISSFWDYKHSEKVGNVLI